MTDRNDLGRLLEEAAKTVNIISFSPHHDEFISCHFLPNRTGKQAFAAFMAKYSFTLFSQPL